MKKSFLLLLLICYNIKLFGQNLDWVKTINSGGYAVTNDVCVDDNNRQYSISYSGSSNSSYYNNISFNNNPTGTLGNIIIKTNPTGSSEWYNSFSGGGNCEPKKILYHNGYIYIAGILSGTSDMDPGPSVYNLYGYFPSPFIVKMDTLGNFIWAKSFGSNNGVGAVVNDLKVDNNQNVFITGSFNASFSFNGTLQTSNGNDDVYFLKFNNQGQEEWCKTFGSNSTNSESGNSIAIDSNGDILVAGMFSGSVDFDAGPGDFTLTSIGIRFGFITKYNQNGNHINTVKIDGTNNTSESRIYSIDINNSSIYVTGTIYGTVDMDPGTLIFNETQLNSGFILKLDPQFNLIWNKIISTTGGSEGKIVKTKLNEVFLSGYMSGTTDLDPDPTNSLIYSGRGSYVVKLNENGNFIWGAGFINTSDPLTMNTYSYQNFTNGIAISNSAVYIAGGFTGPVDFNPDLSNTQITQSTVTPSNIGLPSGFLVKLTNCTTNNTTTQINSCNSYLWTQTGQIYTNPGTYNDTLQNASGCDSIITLVLTITPSSTNTTTASACNSYTWNGQTYTQSGVYTGTTANCVTQALNLTINTNSSSSISQTALDSYTWPVNNQTYTTTGAYTAVIPNAAGCDSIISLNLTITPSSPSLALQVFLDGYYTNSSNPAAMTPARYNNLVASGSTTPGANTDVDVITVELRSPSSLDFVSYSVSPILQTNGSVQCVFPAGAFGGSYYIVVKHRAANPLWSANPILISYGSAYSFVDNEASSYTDGDSVYPSVHNLNPGLYGLWMGELNYDGYLDATDYTTYESNIILSSYGGLYFLNGDLNGDTYVDASDYTVFHYNSQQGVYTQRPYAITTNVSIGQSYQGGIVAYILQPGDPGYDSTMQHGLIAAPSDQGNAQWGCQGTEISGADGTAIGTGAQNTIDIMNGCSEAGIAARLCGDLVLGGYSDWYLPSKDELNKFLTNQTAIGGFASNFYWSSSEIDNIMAWVLSFGHGGLFWTNRVSEYISVRAVRAFSFNTANPSLPLVTTTAISEITSTSANSGGAVTPDVNEPVIWGVCWSTSANPTLANSFLQNTVSSGSFSSALSGLTQNTTYYVRAFASNNAGTAYGNQINFTTNISGSLPTITTVNANNITNNSAVSGGNITSLGGSTVNQRGVCWSTNVNPTIADNITTNGTGSGSFTSSIISLNSNTTYYYRAYATNSAGTAYGNEVSFTSANNVLLTIGQSYQGGIVAYILQAGDPGYDSTMQHGLIAAPSDQFTGILWGCYGTEISGADGTAIGTGAQNTIDIMNGCSEAGIAARVCGDLVLGGYSDWYLPSKDELNQLYINRNDIGGFANHFYWSSSESDNIMAWVHYFNNDNQNSNAKVGYLDGSVRAVRAFSFIPANPTALPTVTTTPVTSIYNNITSGGAVTSNGGAYVTAWGICWSTSTNPTLANSFLQNSVSSGSFSNLLSGLVANTTYYVRAYATNSLGTAYGNEVSFTSGNILFLTIGQSYQGGIIAYILQAGDPGYDANVQKGLIAAPSDQGNAQWGCQGTLLSGADGTAIGTGAQNTIDIMNGCSTAGIAARLCGDLLLGGYSDWYLPSMYELNKLYINKVAIGGFANDYYWSSSESDNLKAWAQYLLSGSQFVWHKGTGPSVRAVRSF